MKTCNRCNEEKSLEMFDLDKRNKDGRQGICSACRKTAKQESRQKRQQGLNIKNVTHKKCNKCMVIKEIDLFYKDSGISDGHATICKECKDKTMSAWRDDNREKYNKNMRDLRANNKEWAKNTDLLRTHGISLEHYNKMLEEQNHVCKLCKCPPKGKRPLVVDHNHKTDEIRGLLCYGCNRKIVILDATEEEIREAKEYVKGKKNSA